MRPASVSGIVLLLCAGLSAWYLYRGPVCNDMPLRRTLWTLVGVYIVLLTVQIATAHKDAETALAASHVLLPLVCGLIAARLCSGRIRAIRLLCLLGIVQALYTLYYVKMGIRLTEMDGAGGTFGDPDAVYICLLVSLPLAAMETMRAGHGRSLACWSVCTAFLVAALVATGNHLGIAAAIVALGWMASHFVKRGRRILMIGLALAVLAVVTVRGPTFGAVHLTSRAVTVRTNLWKASLPHLTSHFWNGSGIGSFESPPIEIGSQGEQGSKYQPVREPGNALLHFMEELGVAGGILACLFLVALFDIFRRQSLNSTLALQGAWIAVLIACLFDTPFGSPGRTCGTALLGILLGTTLLPMSAEVQEVVSTSSAIKGRSLRIPALVTTGVLCVMAACFALVTIRALTKQAGRPEIRESLLPMQAQQLLDGRTDFLGDPNSPATLIEFGDYECPPCRAKRKAVHEALKRNQGKLKLDFRNLPLPTLHPHAMYASIVAEAARRKGVFWRVHSSLFDLNLDDHTIRSLARDQFGSSDLSPELMATARSAVEADMDLATRLHIDGTPSFLLCRPNGKVYRVQAPEDIDRFL
jgi:protein-disulfide isomerase